jgi:hypothetical protein
MLTRREIAAGLRINNPGRITGLIRDGDRKLDTGSLPQLKNRPLPQPVTSPTRYRATAARL